MIKRGAIFALRALVWVPLLAVVVSFGALAVLDGALSCMGVLPGERIPPGFRGR